jgi:hypothetical protein
MLSALIVLGAIGLAIGFFFWWLSVARRIDTVLRTLYTLDRERWREIGKPVGYFWRPKQGEGVEFFRSTNSRNALTFSYLLSHDQFQQTTRPRTRSAGGNPPSTGGMIRRDG